MKILKRIIGLVLLTAAILYVGGFFNREEPIQVSTIQGVADAAEFMKNIPEYSGTPYVVLNGNKPFFADGEIRTAEARGSFEYFSDLDALGRCGTAVACIDSGMMPTEPRGEIGNIKPTGWKQAKYEGLVDSKPPYLYNRCHLIAYSLTGQNANEKNLITGTRYMNLTGMLPFEVETARYLESLFAKGKHVLYRVTPVFRDKNLVADGVIMEAMSLEDNGKGLQFCVFVYNVQPGVGIDYKTGENWRK